MVRADDWESGKVTIPEDFYEPVYQRKPSAIDHIYKNPIICFMGRESGRCLHPEFADILEPAKEGE